MNIKEITKDIKSLTDFINDGACGNDLLSEDFATELDKEAAKLIASCDVEVFTKLIEKISNMNILKMNIHFFDNLPYIWKAYQFATEVTVLEA